MKNNLKAELTSISTVGLTGCTSSKNVTRIDLTMLRTEAIGSLNICKDFESNLPKQAALCPLSKLNLAEQTAELSWSEKRGLHHVEFSGFLIQTVEKSQFHAFSFTLRQD